MSRLFVFVFWLSFKHCWWNEGHSCFSNGLCAPLVQTPLATVCLLCARVQSRGGQGQQPSKYSLSMYPCVVIKRFTPPQTSEVKEMIHPSTDSKKIIIGPFSSGHWWSITNLAALEDESDHSAGHKCTLESSFGDQDSNWSLVFCSGKETYTAVQLTAL